MAEKDLEKEKSVKALNPPRGMNRSTGEKDTESSKGVQKEKINLQLVLEKQRHLFLRNKIIILLELHPRKSRMQGSHPKTKGHLQDGLQKRTLQGGQFGLLQKVIGLVRLLGIAFHQPPPVCTRDFGMR